MNAAIAGLAVLPLATPSPDASYWTRPPEPIAECEALLSAANVRFQAAPTPLRRTRHGQLCGVEQGVRYLGGPERIGYRTAVRVSCGMALALARFERIAQEEAERHLGRRIESVHHLGTYNCREMTRFPGWNSEHAYANAIDIDRFALRGGREVSVLRHYGTSVTPPAGNGAVFLRALTRRLFDEDVFSIVLTPVFDRLHANHLHLDRAHYRVDGTVPDAGD